MIVQLKILIMKKYFLFAVGALFIGTSLHAQLPADLKTATQDVTSMAGPGKLLTQFTDAIKPTAFLGNWAGEKGGWLAKAGKISSAVSMAQSISSLVGFLKPGAFKSGFNVQSLLQTAATATTMSSATGLLKSLEGGLKPETFSDGWAKQKSGWLGALNLVK